MPIVIIGGGVVGLSIAVELSTTTHDDIFLIEKEPFLGHHTSTRNSEVIHAGFAYPIGSLKATLCVEGNRLTYERLDQWHVPYKKCGKWVVASSPSEEAALENAIANGKSCGVTGFDRHPLDDFYIAEPSAHAVTAVAFSATSGLMDVSSYIRSLETHLLTCPNVQLIYPCTVTGIDASTKTISTDRGDLPFDRLINSAGLWADDIYKMSGGQRAFSIVPFKGEYYSWPKGIVQTMIYPVPRRFLSTGDATLVSSMGIHTHRNVAGELLVGPSQVKESPAQKNNYDITTPAELFAHDLSLFVNNVNVTDFRPAYAGNRPKLYEDGHPIGDFTFIQEGPFIHLLGIESPGLTAAPAIAKHVATLI